MKENVNSKFFKKINKIVNRSCDRVNLSGLSKTNSNFEEFLNYDLYIKDLIFDINDTNESLISKNKRLSMYVNMFSNKINKLNIHIQKYENEKKEMVTKLDKIADNYKIFGESHKKLLEIEERNKNKDELLRKYEIYTRASLSDHLHLYMNLQKDTKKEELINRLISSKNVQGVLAQW